MLLTNARDHYSRLLETIYPCALISLIWLAYFGANLIFNHSAAWFGVVKFIIDNGAILALAITSFILWKKSAKESATKIAFMLLTIANSSLFIAATIYNGAYNILHLPHSQNTLLVNSLDDILHNPFFVVHEVGTQQRRRK